MIPVCVFHVFQPHMPLFSIYSLALEQDQDQSLGLQQANATLHTHTFIQVGAFSTDFKSCMGFHFQPLGQKCYSVCFGRSLCYSGDWNMRRSGKR